ncbi:MAG: hypothetical protein VYA55_04040 [Pseudomonadota bacterium]|nr:hypothetical protein [Pseudomonadota bacterium]
MLSFRFTLLFLLTLLCSRALLANEPDYEEPVYEDVYQEESYTEQTYQEQTYQEETFTEEYYAEEPQEQDEAPAYNEPAYQEMPLDNEQAAMVKEARTSCQQWAQESGLEGEDKTLFVEDCVYSQTGL